MKKKEPKDQKKKSKIGKLSKVAAGLGTYFFGGIKAIPLDPPSSSGGNDTVHSVTLS